MSEIKGAASQITGTQRKPLILKMVSVSFRARDNRIGTEALSAFKFGKIADVACPMKVAPARINFSLGP